MSWNNVNSDFSFLSADWFLERRNEPQFWDDVVSNKLKNTKIIEYYQKRQICLSTTYGIRKYFEIS